MTKTRFPLPNEFKRPGDLCSKSFAGQPANHVEATEHAEWGVCRDCGETVNVSRGMVPEHRIPAR